MVSCGGMRIGPGDHASWLEYARMTSWSARMTTGHPACLAGEPSVAGARINVRSNDLIPREGSAPRCLRN